MPSQSPRTSASSVVYAFAALRIELFQFSGDEEFSRGCVILDAKHIGIAADLAVFYIALGTSGRFVDGGGVPFSARCALEAGFHASSIHSQTESNRGPRCPPKKARRFSPDRTAAQHTRRFSWAHRNDVARSRLAFSGSDREKCGCFLFHVPTPAMRALGSFLIVLIQRKNGFKGLVAIEANVIVNGHENLPWKICSGNCTPARMGIVDSCRWKKTEPRKRSTISRNVAL